MLKEVLTEYDLQTTGNKTELITRLTEGIGSDEIDSVVLRNILEKADDSLNKQLADLATVVSGIAEKLNQLEVKQTNTQTNDIDSDPVTPENEHEENSTTSHVTPTPQVHYNVDTQAHIRPLGTRQSYTPPTETSNLRDIVSILPEFDPLSGNLSSEQFIKKIDGLSETYGWSDNTVLFAAQGKLRGYAKKWLDAQPVFQCYESFIDALKRDFPYTVSSADVHIKMMQRQQNRNENVIEYYYEMLALGRHGTLDDRSINQHIINGLVDTHLKQTLRTMILRTCPELLAALNEHKDINDFPTTSRDRSVLTVDRKKIERPPTTKGSNGNNKYQKQLTCYNCGKPNHLSINCPEPQKKHRCQSCQKTTHTTANCPTIKPNVNEINDESDAGLVKDITVNGKKIRSFIDPGSKHSLIRSSIAYELAQTTACRISLKGFAGGRYECVEKTQLKLKLDVEEYDVTMFLVDDNTLAYDILLGRDILCKRGQRLTIENGECYIENILNVTEDTNSTQTYSHELKNLLEKHTSVFANSISELGKCNKVKMHIELTTATPIQLKPYRIPFARRTVVNEIISELLRYDIIRPSTSIYSSPIVLVMKKNGEQRLCVDYRCLNKITKKEPFPMPLIEEQLSQLAGNVYFTTLDLRMGYHQIEVAEDSRKYTAFITNDGHYEYNRMPFGLVNAPGVFQSLMNQMSACMKPGEMLTYLDDVIIPSKTIEEGVERLGRVLTLLDDFGLTLRKEKCKFLATEIQHLGFKINEKGISPGDLKVAAIKEFKQPANQTEVRRFLGLTGFFRKFVPQYALIAEPLTLLLRKDCTQFQWGPKQLAAFTKLIEHLTNAPTLQLYDVNAKHEVHTDACAIGIAGVLLQSTDKTKLHPVMYYSRRCTETESKCHSYELEVLAIVETLERFRIYLLGKQFDVVTDCAAIATMKQTKELKPKISRWWLKLLEYDFNIIHRQGSRLSHVDALSRAPTEDAVDATEAGFIYQIDDKIDDWLYTMQMQDDVLKKIHAVLTEKLHTPQDKQLKHDYTLRNHRIYRITQQGPRFVVPKNIRWRVVEFSHDKMGHFSLEKTLERIRQKFWFPRMTKFVKEYLAACIECCFNKTRGGKTEGELHLAEIDPVPFASIHIDHLGPFIRSNRGNTHIVAISDAFTKFLMVKAVRNTKTAPVISALNELTSYFGLPAKVTTDRGTAYTSRLFEEFCKKNYIRHIKNAVRTPRANGQVERANRIILDYLRTTTTQPKNWDLHLRELQWTINTQKNTTTGFSPNQLIFDFNPRDILKNSLTAALEEECKSSITPIREEALKNMDSERRKWKTRFDNAHSTPREYKLNDMVVLQNEPVSTGVSRKLEPRYKGPYQIAKVLDNDRYVIEDIPGLRKGRKFCSVFASDKIKPWCASLPDIIDDKNYPDAEDDLISGVAEL